MRCGLRHYTVHVRVTFDTFDKESVLWHSMTAEAAACYICLQRMCMHMYSCYCFCITTALLLSCDDVAKAPAHIAVEL